MIGVELVRHLQHPEGNRQRRYQRKVDPCNNAVYNHFNQERSLSSRPNFKLNRAAALAEWRGLCAA